MRNLRSVRGAKVAVAVMALAMTAGACGSDRSGDAVSGDTSGDETTAASGTSFGELESPCGDGDASGATDQGVTDDSITIGYGDDRGYSAGPGLNQEMGDAVKAMIDWCNEQGGINGRQIVGNQYDAAMTNAAAVMQESCKQDFMLVGQGFAYDEAAEQFRVGCDLPTVAGFTIGPNATMGPKKFEAVPLPIDHYNAAPLATAMQEFPEFKQSLGLLESNSPAISSGLIKVKDVLTKLGADIKECGVTLSVDGEANYVPFAQRMKDCGVESVWVTTSPSPISFGFMEALQRVGADLTHVHEATWYGDAVAQWNAQSGAADGMVTGLAFQPLENADVVPAVQNYLDVVEGAGADPSLLGMQSTSAFLLWATVAQECGSDLTRECMVDGLKDVHEWTGGGLHAPTDPGNNMPASCALLMQLEGDTYTQIAPETKGEFNCSDEYVVETDPALVGVELNEDRHSTTFLKQ